MGIFVNILILLYTTTVFTGILCDDGYINSNYKYNDTNISTLPYPYYAPFDSSANFVNVIGALPSSTANFIQNNFAKAYHDEKCKTNKYNIETIYFNPGDTVLLKCVVCTVDQLYNGEMKYWKVLRKRVYNAIYQPREVLDEDWTILDESTMNEFLGNPGRLQYPKHKKENDDDNDVNRTQVKMPWVYQNDGKLYIVNARVEQYGLYECSDFDHLRVHKYAYLVVPRTPYIEVSPNIYDKECDNDEDDDDTAMIKMDGFGKWRSYPALSFSKYSNICGGKICGDTLFDQFSNFSVPIVPGDVDVTMLKKKLNLEVYVKWSEWSNCTNGYQFRKGQCYMRKITDKKFDFEKDGSFGVIQWIYPIHLLLENIPRFRRDGVLLYSAILTDLLLSSQSVPSHCTKIPTQQLHEFKAAILDNMFRAVNGTVAGSNEYKLTPCARKIVKDDYTTIIGHGAIQKMACT
ncbi:unnamed protein product [Bursaphelenchus okinawaensis]|uniref:Ig-like domain-containing protein n=1 Tax=Bursaphelenchus okinawaensis TaxID=465554 RepID=A0A811LNR7_9BILA|nr:unnamed protein product [Bursaphelenchus okinawaensis]CAG9127218.1 unnamed protein product [Bursaphelenchus okinawaensis]